MLSGGLEENVLTMLVWDDKNAPQVPLQVDLRLFSSRAYRTIAEQCYKHLQQFGRPPRAHLRDLLEDDLRRGEDGILLQRIIGQIDALAPELQSDFVLTQLDHFVSSRKLATAIDDASEALHKGDLESARAALYREGADDRSTPGIWLHNPAEALSFLTEREDDFFPSGVEALDVRGVRPRRKTLMLLIAPKKTGKTWWLIEQGKQSILHRRRVLHITLEMSEEKVAQRYVQSLFAMSTQKLATVRLTRLKTNAAGQFTSLDFETLTPELLSSDARATVAKKLEILRGRPPVLIKEFPTGMLTVAQLKAYLDFLDRKHKFRPDLLLIDYPKLMKHDANNLRISLGRNLEELRGIAVERNLALVCPAQGNRMSNTAKLVTSSMLGEDFSMSQTADVICALSRTKAEREANLARVFVDAAREVEDSFVIMISQSYATGQFCLDSVYMNKQLEDAVARHNGEEVEEDD